MEKTQRMDRQRLLVSLVAACWRRLTKERTKKAPKSAFFQSDGGAEGDRTPDLCNAIAALSQLSYGPFRRAL
jgi:hypothetical protein